MFQGPFMHYKHLPLLDLHRHLDGNIRPKTVWELAHENNISLPVTSLESFLPLIQVQSREKDLLSFLKKLDWGVSVLASLDNCKRIAYENVEDAFNAGIHYAELRFSPYYMAAKHNLNVADVVLAVHDGVQLALKKYPMKINLIGILSRTNGADKCQIELDALLQHKDKIVAVDLAGDEVNYPAELFVQHFKQVKDANLAVTIHAGEARDANSVWQAINLLGATRIGHGVLSYQDPRLLDYLRDNNIAIESCLTSNIQTGTVSSLKQHPISTFLNHEICVFLNTDDPAIEGIELKDEFNLAVKEIGFNQLQIKQLQLNAIEAAFLSSEEKIKLRTMLQA